VARLGGDGIEYREQLGEVNAFVADSIQGVRDTVAFGYEKQRAEALWKTGETMGAGQDKLYGADAIQRALAEVFVTVGIIVAAWWGIELAIAGEISLLIELPAVIAVSVIGFYTAVGLANNYTDFRVSIISARRLFSMMDQESAVHDTAKAGAAMPAEGSIHFADVSFQYDADDVGWSRDRKVFDGFSMDIAAGQHVALVGPSGTGKSTVVNLLLRQWDPQHGEICIGDQSVTDFALADLQRYFAVVSQRSYIFNDTIGENIRIGRFDATDAEIEAVVDQAGLREFIESLPAGLDSPAGERGGKLSGGQRQRVAVARAMLKDAPVILLDEATSSLDVETEQSVMAALYRLSEGRTTLTIAHRLSTIVDSDEILVMLDGRIAERGSHRALMALGGWYARMFTLQQDEVDVTLGA
jgi:ATP-binding cassette subfamily C protein CydC